MKTRLLLSLFPLVAACTTPMHKASRVVTFEVPATALQRLGCTSHNGSIRVTGDAKAAVVTVRAELSVRGFTPEEAAANLAQLDVAQEVAGDALTLGGRCPDALRRRFSPAFDFTITAPARLAVSATSHNGGIRAEGVDGEVQATTHNGDLHVTDHTNAAVTGLYDLATMGWSGRACDLLGIDPSVLPRIVDSSGVIGEATALDGSPPIASIVGDQQSSLLGQGCTRPGDTKITFGTGGMLDTVTGSDRPTVDTRLPGGTFPIVAHTSGSGMTFGVEGIMLSAGANVEWLCHDLGILGTPEESDALAASVASSDDVVYVPALLGLGTPHWDYGARGTLLGVTRGTTRAHVVRAVLEGIAHRGADLVDAAVADTGQTIERVRVDGGMSRNITFVQALADVTARPIDVCAITEATTLGAAFLAGTAIGAWASLDEAAAAGQSARTVEPANPARRDRWADAVARSREWIPELSALDF